MNRDSLRKTVVYFVSFAALACIAVGVRFAIHSPLFTVQVVEVGDQPESAPVDAQTISDLAAVKVGRVNLFDLDLAVVERRILAHPWIRQVTLIKRFPATLAISVVFREPRALLQDKHGSLSYVDTDGKLFGRVNVLARSDLPLISGVPEGDATRIGQALSLLNLWSKSSLLTSTHLSTLDS